MRGDARIGIVTCSAASFDGRLAFIVQAKIALVLDRKSLDGGQIVGLLCQGDVICVTLMETPWIVIPEDSFIRHSTMRSCRIRLRQRAFMLISHPDYGELLRAYELEKVRMHFQAGTFQRLPFVKQQLPPAPDNGTAVERTATRTSAAGDNRLEIAIGSAVVARSVSLEFRLHLASCRAEHWFVTHVVVVVRARRSTDAQRLAVCKKGNVLCLGSTCRHSAGNDNWAECCPDALVWSSSGASHPEGLFKGDTQCYGYILKEHPEFGQLITPYTTEAATNKAAELAEKNREATAREKELRVEAEAELRAHARKEAKTAAEGAAKTAAEKDVRAKAKNEAKAQAEKNVASEAKKEARLKAEEEVRGKVGEEAKALAVPTQSHRGEIDRALVPSCPSVSTQTDRRETYQAEAVTSRQDAREGLGITLLTGYGDPWIVEHDQVMVRRAPSMTATPVGMFLKGDLIGVRRRSGDWVELVRDGDVRCRRPVSSAASDGHDSAFDGILSYNCLRYLPCTADGYGSSAAHLNSWRAAISSFVAASEIGPDVAEEDKHQAWMLVNHPHYGTLLRPMNGHAAVEVGSCCREFETDVLDNCNCVLSSRRYFAYREVVNLCYRRIYMENLESLWEGDRTRLPSSHVVEQKLFDSAAIVLHVAACSRGVSTCIGGAIIHRILVCAQQPTAGFSSSSEIGRTTIGYIDACAAEPASHAGSRIWEVLLAMKLVCIACHSILLPETLGFWQNRGMRRYDPAKSKDCDEFKMAMCVRTAGKVLCELSDVVASLPPSRLPLLVYVPRAPLDANEDFVFTSSEGVQEGTT